MAFLIRESSAGIYIQTDEAGQCKHPFMVDGAAIIFPSMSTAAALQQKMIIQKRVNRKEVEKVVSVGRYVASYQGRSHSTLKLSVIRRQRSISTADFAQFLFRH